MHVQLIKLMAHAAPQKRCNLGSERSQVLECTFHPRPLSQDSTDTNEHFILGALSSTHVTVTYSDYRILLHNYRHVITQQFISAVESPIRA